MKRFNWESKGRRQKDAIQAHTDAGTVNTLPEMYTDPADSPSDLVYRGEHKHLNLTAMQSSAAAPAGGDCFSEDGRNPLSKLIRAPAAQPEVSKKFLGFNYCYFFKAKIITTAKK